MYPIATACAKVNVDFHIKAFQPNRARTRPSGLGRKKTVPHPHFLSTQFPDFASTSNISPLFLALWRT